MEFGAKGGGEKKACGNKWMNECRAVTPPDEKAGRKDEKSIKATSEILKAVVEMSAGKSLTPEITEAAQGGARKENQQKAERGREKRTEQNLGLKNG